MRNIIEIRNLKKSYGSKTVLDMPSCDFREGKIYALVGPNGAGKTTLMRVLNCLEPPTEGSMFIEGENPYRNANLPAIRRRMTMVMQDVALFNTTVYNNVAFGLRCRGVDRKTISKKVSEALEMVGLAGFEKRNASILSGGETQRVAIARALVIEPKILLLDEPTANVDCENIKVIEETIKEVRHGYSTTIIFASHDSDQAHRLADEIISIMAGRVIKNN
ncbi:MAG: phosphate ABC transporter ATP-binding protein [bacterium]